MSSKKSYGIILIGLLVMIMGLLPASVQAAKPDVGLQASCALLDNPTTRGLMSGVFETNLLIACGRSNELGQVSAPAAPNPQPLLPLLGTDVQVNDSSGDSGASQTQSETSIAINENTGTICSGFNDSYSGVVQGLGYTGFSRSTDGGATFTDGGALGSTSYGDPSVIWRQSDGFFYLTTIHSSGGLGMWRSTDDCATFTYIGLAHSGTSDDKELTAVDNNVSSPFFGRIYMGWTNFASGGRIYSTYSDNGTTWSAPVALSASGIAVQGAWPTVAPDGTVYIGWIRWDPYYTGPISVEIAKSTNGGTSYSLVTDPMSGKTNPYLQSATNSCGRPALNGNIRYLPSPQITVSPNGDLNAVYSYDPDGRNAGDVINVYYRRSTDGGATWQPEIQLNDDGTLLDQYFPTISAGPSGRLVATWYDRRADAGNLMFTYFMRVSEDGGATWMPSQQVSDVASPVYLDPFLATCYHGDYDQQKQIGDTAYIQWSDDRNVHSGHQDPDVWFDMNNFGGTTGCTSNCLRVNRIQMKAVGAGVGAQVVIQDENGNNISGATVNAHWDLPGGGTADQTGNTNSRGRVTLKVRGGAGTYTITITDVTLAGYTFDPDNSAILTNSITK
jgi:hypothetical protein